MASTITFTVTDVNLAAQNSPVSVSGTVIVSDVAQPSGPINIPLRATATGAPLGTVKSHGHIFAKGQLPAGSPLCVVRQDGTTKLPTQANVMTTWEDGSAKHVMLHFAQPTMSSGAVETFRIVSATSPVGESINLASAVAGRTATVRLNGGAWAVNLLDNLPAQRWFNGPLCSQARVRVPVPTSQVGGRTDVEIVADVTLTSDGVLGVDVAMWNCGCRWAPGGGTISYSIELVGDGGTKMNYSVPNHWLYGRFVRERRWKADGSAAPIPVWIRPPVADLSLSGACMNYDQQLGLDEGYNNSDTNGYLNSSSWDTPLNPRGCRTDQGAMGGHPDIGWVTQHIAKWLVGGQENHQRLCIGQAEAQCGVNMHMWVPQTASWANPVEHANKRVTWHDQDFVTSSGPYGVDDAHWPDAFFIPYVLTGRRSFLDGLQAQASFGVMNCWPNRGERGENSDWNWTPQGNANRLAEINSSGEGALYSRGRQVRAGAWVTRQYVDVVYVLPLSEQPLGIEVWRAIMAAQIRRWWNDRPAANAAQGQHRGTLREYIYGQDNGTYAAWQQDFLTVGLIRAAYVGVPNAKELIMDLENWESGRFLNAANGFNPADGLQVNHRLGPTHSSYWGTWAGIQANLSGPSYGVNMANVVDAAGDEAPRAAVAHVALYDFKRDFNLNSSRSDAALTFLTQTIPPQKLFMGNTSLRRDMVEKSVVRRGTTRA